MKQLIVSLRMLIVLTLLTGLAYPLLVTGVAQIFFARQANGSFIEKGGKAIGSHLIAQKTESTRYFWPRPSAVDYNPLPSGGSNLGPTAMKLKEQFDDRVKKVGEAQGETDASHIPQDLLFASGSGLDPEISPLAAQYQVSRIAKARSLNETQTDQLREMIRQRSEDNQLGFLGEPRVNVLELNLALDDFAK